MTHVEINQKLLREIEKRRVKLVNIHQRQTSGEEDSDEVEKDVIKSFRLSVESLTLVNILLSIVENSQISEYRRQLEISVGSSEEEISSRLF